MSKSVAFLKPKATTTPQILEYVWASDSNAIIVDLSGSSTVSLNANDAKNNLTRLKDVDGNNLNVWRDTNGILYNLDVSGTDISGADFPLAFYVSNENGLRTLTKVTNSFHKFSLPTFSVIDKLFTDQNGTPYYTSYKANIPISLQNASVDISLTTQFGAPTIKDKDNGSIASTGNFAFTGTDNSNNKITIDLSGFRASTTYNPVQYDICLNLNTGFQLSTYSIAKTDISNKLIIKMHQFGMGSLSQTVTKFSSTVDQIATIDLSVNVLSTSTVLNFDTSGQGILASQTAKLQPNVEFMNIVPKTTAFTKSGRQNVSIPITIPAGSSGSWIWEAWVVDGNMKSSVISITLNVQPSFGAPVITLDPTTSSTLVPGLGQAAKFQFKLPDSAFTLDICNNLTRGMLVYPRINAVDPRAPGDVTVNNLKAGLIISGFNDNSTNFIANDLSLNTLTFADLSNNNLSLKFNVGDISLNSEGLPFKVNDVSKNITIDASSNDFNLPSRAFNLYLDWLPNGQVGADTNGVKVQTANIGSVNVATTYSANVNLVDNKDGTYSLSLTDLNGPLDGASYIVKVFKDAKCINAGGVSATASAGNFTMDSQTNVYSVANGGFNVQMDSNFNATFTGPKLSLKTDKIYMVAYIQRDSKNYLYTASTPVSIINAKSPILNISFDTANAFTAADLNKIVNITDTLDINTSLTDLSGYVVKSIDAGIDLSCNLALPLWDLVGPSLTFTINDPKGVVKSMDICGNATKQSKLLPNVPATFTNLSDVSNGTGFYVDLSFNSVKTETLFTLDIALGDAQGNSYPDATKTVAFYYPGTFGSTATNPGGKQNTIIVFNDAKYVLDTVPSLTQMTLNPMDTFNTFTWLFGTPLNSYCLNLARPEFIGDNQILDASGFRIDAVGSTGVTNGETPNLYVQFNGNWTSNNTNAYNASTNIKGMGANNITTTFARSTYSWIDMKKFVGTIDIKYLTKNVDGLSVTPNVLRMVVVPRPNIQASIAVTPNVLINTQSSLQLTVKNIQKNKAGSEITIAGWGPQDISSNKPLSGKFRVLLAATSGSLSLVNTAGAPDVANAGSFTLPTVGDLLYGNAVIVPITFKGRSTAGQVSTNVRANYSMTGSKAISGSSALTVNVYSTAATFNDSVYTNSLSANSTINFAGLPFVQYVALDNSGSSIVLDTDSRTKNAAFVVVENKGAATTNNSAFNSNVGYATTALTGVSAGAVAVYARATNSTWSHLYTKST